MLYGYRNAVWPGAPFILEGGSMNDTFKPFARGGVTWENPGVFHETVGTPPVHVFWVDKAYVNVHTDTVMSRVCLPIVSHSHSLRSRTLLS